MQCFAFKTDHSLISMNLATHSNQRCPGYWKLNTSFLSDNDYVNKIRTTVEDMNDEYSNDASVNPTLKWEMIKLKVREQSIHGPCTIRPIQFSNLLEKSGKMKK